MFIEIFAGQSENLRLNRAGNVANLLRRKDIFLGAVGGRPVNMPYWKTIRSMLDKRRFEYEQDINYIPFVCITADIWSANNKSFLMSPGIISIPI